MVMPCCHLNMDPTAVLGIPTNMVEAEVIDVSARIQVLNPTVPFRAKCLHLDHLQAHHPLCLPVVEATFLLDQKS